MRAVGCEIPPFVGKSSVPEEGGAAFEVLAAVSSFDELRMTFGVGSG
jgi:hypothetical protein